jgi:hypothetical protein
LLDIQHPMIKLDDGRKMVSMKSATGLSWEAISDGLLVIEWFPYHAKRSALLSKPYSPRRSRRFPEGGNYTIASDTEASSKLMTGVDATAGTSGAA